MIFVIVHRRKIMYIDFDYYKVFCYVAKYGKISEAANKLFVSQPAVTQIMKRLEEGLGTHLVIRNRNGIELTEQGKFLYSYVSKSVEILDGVEFKVGKYENLEDGTINIRTGSNTARLVLYDEMEEFADVAEEADDFFSLQERSEKAMTVPAIAAKICVCFILKTP